MASAAFDDQQLLAGLLSSKGDSERSPERPDGILRLHMSITQRASSANVDEILSALSYYIEPGQVTELRVLDYRENPKIRWSVTMFGYYDSNHLADMAKVAADLSPKAKGAYFVPNAINPSTLARCPNHVRDAGKDESTSDKLIVRRKRLLLDFDSKRPDRE